MAPPALSRPARLIAQIREDLNVAKEAGALPARVLQGIAAREDASEVLIKMIQLVIVCLFAALYAIAPRTDAGTAFTPVPYVLAGYFVLTVAGLVWALRARLPDWAVYFSIVLDMTLLMTLIASFHIQYQQPASFLLKAPTLLYVFIFIALRTLRFQPRFVIAAGLTAAAGWGVMILYVINVDPEDTMITRSYVEYLTGNSILLGAEFDKIVAILTVTFVLALALRRGRHMLVDAVAESTAARDLSRFFDESVAEEIRKADHEIAPGEGVKRVVSVLNVDIRGFTPLAASMDPGDVMHLLSDYHAHVVPVIQAHHGSIDKFLGDGIMATFGAVRESDSFAADALRAVDDIIAAVERWNAARAQAGDIQLEVNLSVASGEVVVGAVGGQNRLEFTVIGPAVNLSAKLEKHNKDLGARALSDGDTLQLALRQGYQARNEYKVVETQVPGTSGKQRIVILYG
ncbi:MAG: adenylate/guanylate cyclase domain-containing protein [Methyloligellaceae bacterium]